MHITLSDGILCWGIPCTVISLCNGTDIEMVKQYEPLSLSARKCYSVAIKVVYRRLGLLNVIVPEVVDYPIEVTDRDPEFGALYHLLVHEETRLEEYYEEPKNNVIIVEEE
jgi:phage FluMu gp28-like protein